MKGWFDCHSVSLWEVMLFEFSNVYTTFVTSISYLNKKNI